MKFRRASRGRDVGSAPVESLVAILFVSLAMLAVVQVALFLYARNVVAGAAHEAARAAVERGRDLRDARDIANATIRRAAGGLVRNLEVRAVVAGTATPLVQVEIRGSLRPIGPLPVGLPLRASATAARYVEVP